MKARAEVLRGLRNPADPAPANPSTLEIPIELFSTDYGSPFRAKLKDTGNGWGMEDTGTGTGC
jgi:hypothetical protein